jgi:hypothetical protein
MDSNDTPPRDEAGRFLGDHYAAEHARLEFTPMEDNREREEDAPQYGSSDQEVREAARELQARRGVQTEVVDEVRWHDRYGDPLPSDISTSRDQAAEALNAYRQAKAEAAQAEQDRDLKAAIDAPRVEMAVLDEKNARQYQFDNELERAVGEFAAEMGAPETPPAQPTVASEQQPARESSLDPDLAKVISHPQVVAMLEGELGRYAQAIQEAGQYAAASLVDALPELAQIDRQSWPMAIELIGKQSPERVQRATNVISRAIAIGAEQQRLAEQHQAKQNAQRNAEIEKWTRAEGQKYDAWAAKEGIDVGQLAPQVMKYVETNLGLSRAEFSQALRDNPALRSSAFQQAISDAVRYRQVMAAKADLVQRPLPPAPIRPGAQPPSGASSHSSNAGQIAEVSRRLSNASGMQAIRLAAKLTSLKRGN